MSGDGVLVLACGAIARELRDVIGLHQLGGVSVECLPASLHNRPDRIPDAVRARLDRAADRYDRILLGYADCGTGGHLDMVCEEYGVERIPGAHCYEFLVGHDRFVEINDDDPTAFYLTDYLAKHFDRLIIEGLGIARHPELTEMYFGNYTRVVLLEQTGDPVVRQAAEAAAARLDLPLEVVAAGYGELETTTVTFVEAPSRRRPSVGSSARTPAEVAT